MGKNTLLIDKYVNEILSGEKLACKETVQMCQRYRRDIASGNYDFNVVEAEYVIEVIETQIVHDRGRSLDNVPLRGKPLLLEAWQKFIIYNLLGFYKKGIEDITGIDLTGRGLRKYKEAFIFIPRKNGKTRFIAALSWALSLLAMETGSTLYIVANSREQSKQSFEFILFNLREMAKKGDYRVEEFYRILSNNAALSIESKSLIGSMKIDALASNPDKQDSLNCTMAIADEMHEFRSAKQYEVIHEAMISEPNGLMIGITTAGDRMNGFCYHRLTYCQKILARVINDESYFVFIAKADEDEKGVIDYTNPEEHEKANPNYGVSVSPTEILSESLKAQNDPVSRDNFLQKRVNKFTTSMRAYFNIDEFKISDGNYTWTLEELSRLPINWYGGADLSKMHDLTATALYGNYEGVDIIISHAWFPVLMAQKKMKDDGIPLHGWRDSGWLTLCNTATMEYTGVVDWFVEMRDMGFKVKQVGFDIKYGREFFHGMKKKGFNIIEEPQYYPSKSEGFRRIEKKAKDGKLYYLNSEAFEYCIQNVHAIEKDDDAIQYEKVEPSMRIDLFDASVFASVRMLRDTAKAAGLSGWLNGGN